MLATLMAAMLGAASPADASLNMVVGRWETETRGGIIEIARCGGSICGRLMTSVGLRADPSLRDLNNKDASLRGRPLKGMLLMQGFTPGSGGVWDSGNIYNAEDGRTYKARITPVDADHLKLRGCVFVPLCQTQTWTRVR